jgi:hypothetical protein
MNSIHHSHCHILKVEEERRREKREERKKERKKERKIKVEKTNE